MTVRLAALLICLAAVCRAQSASSSLPSYNIFNLAGNGQVGHADDTNPTFHGPQGIWYDSVSRALWVADTANNLIRRVEFQLNVVDSLAVVTNVVATTVAGSGRAGVGGCKQPGDTMESTTVDALTANIWLPEAVAADNQGHVYIADTQNNCVRMLSGSNVITYAGNGTEGGSGKGDGGSPLQATIAPGPLAFFQQSDLLITDFLRVRRVENGIIQTVAGGGQTIPSTTGSQSATGAALGDIYSIASTTMNSVPVIYVANVSQVFIVNGGSLQYFIGGEGLLTLQNYPAGGYLRSPYAMAVDTMGNLLIADTQYHVILRVTPGGSIDIIAGMYGDPGSSGDGALATQARLNTPMGLAVDPVGNIYIADTVNNRIRVLVPTTGGSNPNEPSLDSGKQLGDIYNSQGSPGAGDPVTIANGNVFQSAMDYQTAGPNVLGFNRYYNSLGDPNTLATELGVKWRSTYDRYIRISSPTSVVAERPDGQMLKFTSNGGAWSSDTDVDVRLTQSGSTWTLTDINDTVETYSTVSATEAILNTIGARNGYTRTFAYDDGKKLLSVTDSYNRSVNFTYSGNLLQTVSTPDGLTISYGYSSSGVTPGVQDQLTSVTYSTQPATTLSYLYGNSAVPFALTGIVDEDGNRYASWTYDSSSRALTSQQGARAEMATIVYNDSDGSRTVTNGLGQQEVYRFTTLQNVPKTTEIDRAATASVTAATRTFTYDANGYVASKTDWNGNLTNYVNDVHGQPTVITEAVGTAQQRAVSITYHAAFHLPIEIVAPGITTDFAYDDGGELLTLTRTDTTNSPVPYATSGQTRTWTYTWANSLLTSMQSPRTDVTGLTQLGYDSSGTLTSITNALGQQVQVTQHLLGGLPLAIVDANGVTTRYSFDPRSRLLSTTVNSGAGPLTTNFTYDPAGNLSNVALPDASAFSASYDSAHRLTGISDLFQQTVSYSLDTLGDLTRAIMSGADGTTQLQHNSTFDSMGRMVQDIGGAGQTNTYTYDANGNSLSVTDPLNRLTQQAFDAVNRPVKITNPADGSTGFAYDALDRPLSVTDANGNTTTYTYDGFGDLIQQISPDTGTTTYCYDPDGNLTQEMDATGAVVTYSYDALDRIVAAAYPADPSQNVTLSYDQAGFGFSVGQLTTVSDAAGTLTRSYDERGNMLTETRAIGAATLVTSYTYDANSRIASVTYPSGWQVANVRDAMGRITDITAQDPSGDPTLPAISNVGYQAYGPVNALTFGNGLAETRNFDPDYRLTSLADNGSSALQNLAYGYDSADNVLSVRDGINAGNSQTFQYDLLARMTNAMGSYGTFGYTYDPVGNRLSQIAGSVVNTYTYTAGSNQLASSTVHGAVRNFSYTADGNVSSFGPYNLTYNQAGRLSAVASGSQPVAQYTYDAFGHRLAKSGATTTLYQYDPSGRLIEETDNQGNALADYIYLGTIPTATLDPGTGQIYYLHDDRLGTPQLATDSNQNVAWIAAYHPFGALRETPALIVQDLRLPGQENDSDTGLYQNGFRDYVPSLGRYLESDPMGLAAGPNTYAYANGNPARFIDPSGLNSSCSPTGDCFLRGEVSNAPDTSDPFNGPAGWDALNGGAGVFGAGITNVLERPLTYLTAVATGFGGELLSAAGSLGDAGIVGVRTIPRTPFFGHGGYYTGLTPGGYEFTPLIPIPAGKTVLLPTRIGGQIPLKLGLKIGQGGPIDFFKFPAFRTSRLRTGGDLIPRLIGAPAEGYDAAGRLIGGNPYPIDEMLERPDIINLRWGACVEHLGLCPGR